MILKLLSICVFVHAVSAKLVQLELNKAPSVATHPSLQTETVENKNLPALHLSTLYQNTYYLADVSLGSPSQKFKVALHTGSTTLWVFDKVINSDKGYNTNASTTSTLLDMKHEFFDNTDDIIFKGRTYTDVIQIGDLKFENQSFGAIERIEENEEPFLADGILGLGWVFDLADRHKDEMPIMNLLSQLDKPLFSVWLEKAHKPTEPSKGLLTLGGLDTKHCQQNVNFVPASKSDYWLSTFQIDGVSVGDYKSADTEEFVGILDSGSSVIHAENHAHNAFFKQLNAQFDEQLKMYTIECGKMNSLPSWKFKIGGIDYEIQPKEYLLELESEQNRCALAIQHYSSEGFGFTLGQPFMRSYCTVFDVGANRFGFSLPQ